MISTAVIMVGGYGIRLRPLTNDLPKPMLPIGNRPLLEFIIQQLRRANIKKIYLATHYKGETISSHFGDGEDFGVSIDYILEEKPLGTAGALALLECLDETLLVINGDILAQVDFNEMWAYHKKRDGDMTIAVRSYEVHLPYGVVHTEDDLVIGISEKPTSKHFINAGIYLLNPYVYKVIPKGEHCDMTELIEKIINDGWRVVSFPITDYWQDIGQIEDYEKAGEYFGNHRLAYTKRNRGA